MTDATRVYITIRDGEVDQLYTSSLETEIYLTRWDSGHCAWKTQSIQPYKVCAAHMDDVSLDVPRTDLERATHAANGASTNLIFALRYSREQRERRKLMELATIEVERLADALGYKLVRARKAPIIDVEDLDT
jgi:hypothetical protein